MYPLTSVEHVCWWTSGSITCCFHKSLKLSLCVHVYNPKVSKMYVELYPASACHTAKQLLPHVLPSVLSIFPSFFDLNPGEAKRPLSVPVPLAVHIQWPNDIVELWGPELLPLFGLVNSDPACHNQNRQALLECSSKRCRVGYDAAGHVRIFRCPYSWYILSLVGHSLLLLAIYQAWWYCSVTHDDNFWWSPRRSCTQILHVFGQWVRTQPWPWWTSQQVILGLTALEGK